MLFLLNHLEWLNSSMNPDYSAFIDVHKDLIVEWKSVTINLLTKLLTQLQKKWFIC